MALLPVDEVVRQGAAVDHPQLIMLSVHTQRLLLDNFDSFLALALEEFNPIGDAPLPASETAHGLAPEGVAGRGAMKADERECSGAWPRPEATG